MRHRDENKKNAVIDAAIRLINTLGFSDVSISKIAREAGVSPASIYIYFENKEDMINKIYISLKAEMGKALMTATDSEGSIEIFFKQILKNLYKYALANPDRFAFCEQFANSPLIEKITMEEALSAFSPIQKMFELGLKNGTIKNIPFEVMTAFSYQPMISLAKRRISGHADITEDTFEQAIDMAWDAISAG